MSSHAPKAPLVEYAAVPCAEADRAVREIFEHGMGGHVECHRIEARRIGLANAVHAQPQRDHEARVGVHQGRAADFAVFHELHAQFQVERVAVPGQVPHQVRDGQLDVSDGRDTHVHDVPTAVWTGNARTLSGPPPWTGRHGAGAGRLSGGFFPCARLYLMRT